MNEALPDAALMGSCWCGKVPFYANLESSLTFFQLPSGSNGVCAIIKPDCWNWAMSTDEPPNCIYTGVCIQCICHFQVHSTTGQIGEKHSISFKKTSASLNRSQVEFLRCFLGSFKMMLLMLDGMYSSFICII